MLDEPTEGIQPSIIQEISKVLKELRQTQNLTIILVEQNLDFIASVADRVLIIQTGRITREVDAKHLGDAVTMGEYTGFSRATSRSHTPQPS